MSDETKAAAVETRCSCGAHLVICKGEYHDCAAERSVALQKRQVEALESIARSLLTQRTWVNR